MCMSSASALVFSCVQISCLQGFGLSGDGRAFSLSARAYRLASVCLLPFNSSVVNSGGRLKKPRGDFLVCLRVVMLAMVFMSGKLIVLIDFEHQWEIYMSLPPCFRYVVVAPFLLCRLTRASDSGQ